MPEWPARAEIALNQAAFSAAPSLHPDRPGAPFHGIDGGSAKLRAQGGKRPSFGIDHTHSALAVDEDGEIAGVAIAGHRNVENLFGPPQECFHNRHIDPVRRSFRKICYNCCMRVLFIGGTGIISTACTQLAAQRGIDLTLATRGRRAADLPARCQDTDPGHG